MMEQPHEVVTMGRIGVDLHPLQVVGRPGRGGRPAGVDPQARQVYGTAKQQQRTYLEPG